MKDKTAIRTSCSGSKGGRSPSAVKISTYKFGKQLREALSPTKGEHATVPDSLDLKSTTKLNVDRASWLLDTLCDDLYLLLNLRRIDTAFFANNFGAAAKADIPAKQDSLSVESFKQIETHVAKIATHLPGGYKLYKRFLSNSYVDLSRKGGEMTTYSFRDLEYSTLWEAYLSTLKSVRSANDIGAEQVLSALKSKTKSILEGELLAATQKSVSNLQALEGTHGQILRDVSKALLAITIPATFGSFFIAANVADREILLNLKKQAKVNQQLKTEVLIASLYETEQKIRASKQCDITNQAGGCESGSFCKREFVFLPQDPQSFRESLFSPVGHCAQSNKPQVANGMACLLHSDCRSGYCSYGHLVVEKGDQVVQISARNAVPRGDMTVDPSTQGPLTSEQRLIALSGVCMRAGAVGESGCRVITDQHKFTECPQETRDRNPKQLQRM